MIRQKGQSAIAVAFWLVLFLVLAPFVFFALLAGGGAAYEAVHNESAKDVVEQQASDQIEGLPEGATVRPLKIDAANLAVARAAWDREVADHVATEKKELNKWVASTDASLVPNYHICLTSNLYCYPTEPTASLRIKILGSKVITGGTAYVVRFIKGEEHEHGCFQDDYPPCQGYIWYSYTTEWGYVSIPEVRTDRESSKYSTKEALR